MKSLLCVLLWSISTSALTLPSSRLPSNDDCVTLVRRGDNLEDGTYEYTRPSRGSRNSYTSSLNHAYHRAVEAGNRMRPVIETFTASLERPNEQALRYYNESAAHRSDVPVIHNQRDSPDLYHAIEIPQGWEYKEATESEGRIPYQSSRLYWDENPYQAPELPLTNRDAGRTGWNPISHENVAMQERRVGGGQRRKEYVPKDVQSDRMV